uniref:Uncharacterized protein n=1 Tax=Spongospora subterranea TaxID=70186 RepID=A0A0H5QIP3_9EUKA|eukprot:CRZ01517.1 hypothetical protein [Spongospora subterranea]
MQARAPRHPSVRSLHSRFPSASLPLAMFSTEMAIPYCLDTGANVCVMSVDVVQRLTVLDIPFHRCASPISSVFFCSPTVPVKVDFCIIVPSVTFLTATGSVVLHSLRFQVVSCSLKEVLICKPVLDYIVLNVQDMFENISHSNPEFDVSDVRELSPSGLHRVGSISDWTRETTPSDSDSDSEAFHVGDVPPDLVQSAMQEVVSQSDILATHEKTQLLSLLMEFSDIFRIGLSNGPPNGCTPHDCRTPARSDLRSLSTRSLLPVGATVSSRYDTKTPR